MIRKSLYFAKISSNKSALIKVAKPFNFCYILDVSNKTATKFLGNTMTTIKTHLLSAMVLSMGLSLVACGGKTPKIKDIN